MHVRGCSVHPSGVLHTGGAGRVASIGPVSTSDRKSCFSPREHPGSIGGKSRDCLGVAPCWTPDQYAGVGWEFGLCAQQAVSLRSHPAFFRGQGTWLLPGAPPDSAIPLVGWCGVDLAAGGGDGVSASREGGVGKGSV